MASAAAFAPSPAELAADLRAARRRVQDLQRALESEQARAARLESERAAAVQERCRVMVERDQARRELAELRSIYERNDVCEEAHRETIANRLATEITALVGRDLELGLAAIEPSLEKIKPGRVLVLQVEVKPGLSSFKGLPDNTPGGRKRLIECYRSNTSVRRRSVVLWFQGPNLDCAALYSWDADAPTAESDAALAAPGRPR